MSISDEIVVMNYGVEKQMEHPQNVYDEPNCLFVAKFLGNPPINVLDGKIENGKVVLCNGDVIKSTDLNDQNVKIGLRPEFFVVDENGPIHAKIDIIQHIGRDTMLICNVENHEGTIRVIVPSLKGFEEGMNVNLDFTKVFVFADDEDGGRLI